MKGGKATRTRAKCPWCGYEDEYEVKKEFWDGDGVGMGCFSVITCEKCGRDFEIFINERVTRSIKNEH